MSIQSITVELAQHLTVKQFEAFPLPRSGSNTGIVVIGNDFMCHLSIARITNDNILQLRISKVGVSGSREASYNLNPDLTIPDLGLILQFIEGYIISNNSSDRIGEVISGVQEMLKFRGIPIVETVISLSGRPRWEVKAKDPLFTLFTLTTLPEGKGYEVKLFNPAGWTFPVPDTQEAVTTILRDFGKVFEFVEIFGLVMTNSPNQV